MAKLPKELTTVTPLSRLLALALFVFLPVFSFYVGTLYEQNISQQLIFHERELQEKLPAQPKANNMMTKPMIPADWNMYEDKNIFFNYPKELTVQQKTVQATTWQRSMAKKHAMILKSYTTKPKILHDGDAYTINTGIKPGTISNIKERIINDIAVQEFMISCDIPDCVWKGARFMANNTTYDFIFSGTGSPGEHMKEYDLITSSINMNIPLNKEPLTNSATGSGEASKSATQ